MQTYLLVSKNHDAPRKIAVTYSAFPDGDTHCLIEAPLDVKDCDVLVVHSLYPSQNDALIQLFLLLDLLRDEGAKSTSICVPYLPYARQDRQHVSGEAVSIDTVCRLLASMSCKQLFTFDCHFMKGVSEAQRSGLLIHNFSLGPQLIAYCQEQISHASFDILSPDDGAQYLVGGDKNKSMHKRRGSYAGLAAGDSYRHISALSSDHITVAHDTVLIVDDMISTGSTMLRAIDNLKSRGVKHIYCVAAHGLFIGDAYEKLTARAERVIFSDTIAHPDSRTYVDAQLAEQIIPAWLAGEPSSAITSTKKSTI